MNETPDTADADALDELMDSRGWKLVKARLEMQLQRDRNVIEIPGTPESLTEQYRGSIGRTRMMLGLPKSMRDEIKEGLKQ